MTGGLGLQQLEAGFQFLARDWSQAMAVRALNPNHQEPVASEKALAF